VSDGDVLTPRSASHAVWACTLIMPLKRVKLPTIADKDLVLTLRLKSLDSVTHSKDLPSNYCREKNHIITRHCTEAADVVLARSYEVNQFPLLTAVAALSGKR
jgi:hypothetical protein